MPGHRGRERVALCAAFAADCWRPNSCCAALTKASGVRFRLWAGLAACGPNSAQSRCPFLSSALLWATPSFLLSFFSCFWPSDRWLLLLLLLLALLLLFGLCCFLFECSSAVLIEPFSGEISQSVSQSVSRSVGRSALLEVLWTLQCFACPRSEERRVGKECRN